MSTYFFTADHHFDHANIIKFCNRPFDSVEEMNEELIARHNSVVKPGDVVVVAGDFSFASRIATYRKFVSRLNGDLIFLRGSHDRWLGKNTKYREIWSKRIENQVVVVCHYAMRTWPLSHYNSWQLYGHSHGKLKPEGKQLDVGVDTNNFFPYSWDKIKKLLTNQPDNFNYIKRGK